MQFRNRQRTSPKPKRLYSVGWLEDKLDELTSKIVRRNELICFTCDTVVNLQCGHLFERRHRPTRWDVSLDGNNHSQCPKCNANHENHPEIYRDKYIQRFGEEAYQELYRRAHASVKFTYSDLIELLEGHKSVWERARAA